MTADGLLDSHGAKGVKLGKMSIRFGQICCMEVVMNIELRNSGVLLGMLF